MKSSAMQMQTNPTPNAYWETFLNCRERETFPETKKKPNLSNWNENSINDGKYQTYEAEGKTFS